MIVFIHVPKTAGTTFVSVLARNAPVGRVHLPNAFSRADELEERLRSPRVRDARLLHGHVPLSVRAELPAGARYITFLREPIARAHSHYRHMYNELIDRGEAPPLSDPQIPDNLQTRMLSGLPDSFTRPADDELLAAAVRELSNLAFVGVLERFGESMLLARQRLGLRWIAYRRENIRPSAPLPDDTREILRAQNELDLELYDRMSRALDPSLSPFAPRARTLDRAAAALTAGGVTTDPSALVHVVGFHAASADAALRRRAARWRKWRVTRIVRALR